MILGLPFPKILIATFGPTSKDTEEDVFAYLFSLKNMAGGTPTNIFERIEYTLENIIPCILIFVIKHRFRQQYILYKIKHDGDNKEDL